MKSLLLRNIPEYTLEKLKRRAQRHHRSLQGELHALLEEASTSPLVGDPTVFHLKKVRTHGTQDWSREMIYDD